MEITEKMGSVVICIFVSIIFFGSAYLIGYKKNLSLIAGFDASSYTGDKDKLAKKGVAHNHLWNSYFTSPICFNGHKMT